MTSTNLTVSDGRQIVLPASTRQGTIVQTFSPTLFAYDLFFGLLLPGGVFLNWPLESNFTLAILSLRFYGVGAGVLVLCLV
jgi:hypothetical protein